VARAEAGGGWPRFPGAEAPGYRKIEYLSTYSVDDHKRRAIENFAYRSNYLADGHEPGPEVFKAGQKV